MALDSSNNDIPVWFDGTQRWMTGLTKRTTCDDVIYAIFVSTGLHETESTNNFAIFEKWREVERPLSARTKILKVWSFWGEEQPNVQLSMRSLDDYFLPGDSSLYMRSRRRHKRSNRNRDRHASHCKCQNKRSYLDCSKFRTMEQLVKLVVGQERKIQDLNERIHDTDKLIDKHESRIHMHRVQQNGLDYVQDSYLNSFSSESTSSAEGSNVSSRELQAIFQESNLKEVEEIFQVCDSLDHVERRIEHEQLKISEMTREIEKLTKNSGVLAQQDGETNAELDEARVQMIRAVTTYVTNEYNERELDRKLDMCLREFTDRTEKMNEINTELCKFENGLAEPNLQGVLTISLNNYEADTNSENQETSSLQILPVNRNSLTSTEERNYLVSESGPFSNHETVLTYEHHYHIHKQSSESNNLMDISKAASVTNSSTNSNILTSEKAWTHRRNSDTVSKFSDHILAVPFSKEGCLRRRSKNSQQPRQNRSRSAERSCEHSIRSPRVSPFEAFSNSDRISDGENHPKSPWPREYTASGVVDQYGLELGARSRGQNLGNSFSRGRSILPSNSDRKIVTTSETNNQLQGPYDVLESAGHDLKYQQQNKQGRDWRYQEKNYNYSEKLFSEEYHRYNGDSSQSIDETRLFSDNSNRNHREYIQPRSGVHTYREELNSDNSNINCGENSQSRSNEQKLSSGNMPESRLSTSNHKRRPEINNLYTSGDQVGISCLGDSVLKDRSLFKQNISGLSRTELYNCNGVQIVATNNEGRRQTTPNKPSNSVKGREVNSSNKFQKDHKGGKDMALEDSVSSSNDYQSSERKQDTQGSGAKITSQSPNNSGNSTQGEQTIEVCPPTQRGKQSWTEYSQQDEFRQNAQNNKQYGLNDWLQFQHTNYQSSNGELRRSERPRQQATSLIPDVYSARDVPENGMCTPSSYNIKETTSSDTSDMCVQREVVGNADTTYHTLRGTTNHPQKESPFNADRIMKYSENMLNIKGNTGTSASSSSLTPAKITSNNNKVVLPLVNNISTSQPGMCDGGSMDTSRGALYHIVSNKMNKSKTEFKFNDHDSKRLPVVDTSLKHQTGCDKSNVGVTTSTEFQSSRLHDTVNSQAQMYYNKEQHSPSTFRYSNNNMHCKSPANTFNKTQFSGVLSIAHLSSKSENTDCNNGSRSWEKPSGMRTDPHTSVYDTITDSPKTMHNHSYSINNSRNKSLFSTMNLQNCINQINNVHSRGYITQRIDAVNIKDISENSSTTNDYYSSNSRSNYMHGNNKTGSNFGVGNSTKIEDANDSNSDTGLSSMHSDETPNIETLV